MQATKIKVIGVGGSGCNAVTRMKNCKLRGVELIAVNSDAQDLEQAKADQKIRIGRELTQGLGTGMDPSRGRKAAQEQQDELEQAVEDADLVFVTCGEGGGCLRASSKILTGSGKSVRIDSIEPGSEVYSFEDNDLVKKRVIGKEKTGVKEVMELKTNNRTIYASKDHPFLRVEPQNELSANRFSEFDLEWVELQNIEPEDTIVILRQIPDDGEPFELPDGSLTDEDFCRLFGFLLGDGWISRSEESWKVHFSPGTDEEQNQEYMDLMKSKLGLEMKETPSADWYYDSSKEVYELLDELGLNKPAPEKEIPDWIFGLPEQQKKAFIIGLADADGSYSIQKKNSNYPKKEIKFELSSEKLIRQLKSLCDSIGLRTSNVTSRTRKIKAPHSKKAEPHTSWLLRIYRTHELLGEKVHSDAQDGKSFVCDYRSRDLPSLFDNFGFNKVKSVREVGEEEVYDIRVEGSHNFIADGCVVHNTGTGAAPVIAEAAKENGALTVAVVTKPFSFEGAQRKRTATQGLKKLEKQVDTLVVVPNDKITELCGEDVDLKQAFWMADEVLRQAVSGISELIVGSGIVNVDFADVKTIMEDSGRALFGMGKAEGELRAKKAIEQALNSPFLGWSIEGAEGALFSVSGQDITLSEIDEIASVLSDKLNSKAKLIFGAIEDDDLKKKELKVTLIATGFE